MKSCAYIPLLCTMLLACDPPAKELEQDEANAEEVQFTTKRFYASYEGCNSDADHCTYFEVTYPQFESSFEALNRFVNSIKSPAFDPDQRSLPLDSLASDFIGNYVQFKSEFPESRQVWYMKHTIKVEQESDTLVVLSAAIDEYGGGAHSNYTISFHNLNKSTGKPLALSDLYSQEEIDRMGTIMTISINPEITLLTETIAPNSNFLLTKDSITFVYNPYEIAPYSEGIIRLTLPIDQSPIM